MATSSKVKVSTEKLLEAVKVRRAAMVAEHERALAKYERDQDAYSEALRRAVMVAEGGRLPEQDHGYRGKYLKVSVRFDRPTRPTLATDMIDRLIATLEMASDPTLTISADDAARYLG